MRISYIAILADRYRGHTGWHECARGYCRPETCRDWQPASELLTRFNESLPGWVAGVSSAFRSVGGLRVLFIWTRRGHDMSLLKASATLTCRGAYRI